MAQHKHYHVTYPKDQWLTDDEIERMFCDALAANEIGIDYHDARDPDAMAEALEDMGFIRLCCTSSSQRMPFDHHWERRHAGKLASGYDTLEEKRIDQQPIAGTWRAEEYKR